MTDPKETTLQSENKRIRQKYIEMSMDDVQSACDDLELDVDVVEADAYDLYKEMRWAGWEG